MFFEFDDFDVRDRFFTIEEKTAKLRLYLESISPEKQREFKDLCLRAFIFHDSALDGVVVTGEEIASVFSQDSSSPYLRSRILQEIRNHRDTFAALKAQVEKKRSEDTVHRSEVIRPEHVISMHELLYANIARKDAGKLRKAVPLHSAYFHNFVDPKLVEKRLQELCKQTEHTEFQAQHPINQAVLFHRQFMNVFPFMEGSGKVGRIFMNSFLLQGGYDPVVIHSSERQRYYETLRDGPEALRELLLDSMDSALESQLKFVSEIETPKSPSRVTMRAMGLS